MMPRTTTASASTPGKMRLIVTRLDSLPATTQPATLVVYDYDIYRSSQVEGKNAGGGGFWEIDATHFENGGKIPGTLQRHDVGPGTGVLAKIDHRVRIPMRGQVESLNVATAAAVLLYDLVRRDTMSRGE